MRAVVKYCSSEPGLELAHWEEELAHLLAAHPQHNDWSSSSEDETEEDSHGSDPPDSLSSSGEHQPPPPPHTHTETTNCFVSFTHRI